ncbi:MAG: DUF5074 domain-containing protein [Bacteroidales bacterium]
MKINQSIVRLISFLVFGILVLWSCRKEEIIIPPTYTQVTKGVSVSPIKESIKGFYLLNEGNMGSNKCTLDYFDYETGKYVKNIYAYRNPGVVKELGDVGNDIQIYDNKIFCVINCSNFIEVMDSKAKHITQISIPNCRYIRFKNDFAYVSSYAGPVAINSNARKGYVFKIDLNSWKVEDSCVVGYQPEELEIIGDKLYVVNSGGYTSLNYDNTVSVIDLKTFTETKKIEVAINLHGIEQVGNDKLYISSRGDYNTVSSQTYIINTKDDTVSEFPESLPNTNMSHFKDSLYLYSSDWSSKTNKTTISYALVNTQQDLILAKNLIKDGTDVDIKIPYGIAVNPETKDFFVTDAGNYVTPGTLYCFDKDGIKKWEVITGDIPAHIAFTTVRLEGLFN